MSDFTSADRLAMLSEVLTYMNGVMSGNISQFPRISKILENMSPEGIETLKNYADKIDGAFKPEQVFEDALHGSYDLNDLKITLSNLLKEANDVDGDLNNISLAVKSHMPNIEALASADTVDHKALFQEVFKTLALAAVGDVANFVRGNRPTGEQGALEVSEYKGSFYATMIVAANIAKENGVDVDKAIQELQDQHEAGLTSTWKTAGGEAAPEDQHASVVSNEQTYKPV